MQDSDIGAWWDAHPCNIRHGISPAYTKAWSDEIEARKYRVEPHIPHFAQFERWRGKRVLEVGCGIGTDTLNFARHGARITAIDISARSVEIARRRLAVNGLFAEVLNGNIESAQWLVDAAVGLRFDLVYSFGVLHHTADPLRALILMKSLCHYSTEIRLMLYTRWSWKSLSLVLRHGWRWHYYTEAAAGCPVSRVYSHRQIRRLLSAAGLEAVSIRKAHIFPWVVSEYARHRYVIAWPWKWMPQPMFAWFERHLGWHTLVVARVKQ